MTALLAPLRPPPLKEWWRRLALRGTHYADLPRRLDRLYLVEDPWALDTPKEEARFAWTNRIIAAQLAPLGRILEIGCGEGHQSRHLATLCERLYGIDVSRRAVRRARRRCPTARFVAGDPFGLAPELPAPFDLVVACEVLYYVKDVPRFLAQMTALGRACLVTYYGGQAPALDPYFTGFAGCGRESFRCDGTEWQAVWWRSAAPEGAAA